jgi:hypothetical protein
MMYKVNEIEWNANFGGSGALVASFWSEQRGMTMNIDIIPLLEKHATLRRKVANSGTTRLSTVNQSEYLRALREHPAMAPVREVLNKHGLQVAQ